MKRKIRACIIEIILILVIGLCGCTLNKVDLPKNTESVEPLNERQKSILIAEGLPADYNELNMVQKSAILAIEEMLSETEKKYDISFNYLSYSDGGLLGYEELAAYPADGDKDKDVFVITRRKKDGTYVYSDGYANLAAQPVFNNFVQEFVLSKVGQDNAKVYSVVTNILNGIYPVNEDDIRHNIGGESWIFIDGANIDELSFNQFILDYKIWAEENGISGSTQFILLKADILLYLTEYNYTDYLSPDYYTKREYSYR